MQSRMVEILTTAVAAVLLAAAGGAQAEEDNTSMGGITAYQVRSDDCALSGCGYISPEIAAGLYNLGELARVDSRGSAMMIGNSLATAKAGQRPRLLGVFDNLVQTVYLDFDTGPPLVLITDFRGAPVAQLPAHQYTQDERNAVQARLEADFQQFRAIRFTQTRPADGRKFTTLTFSCDNGLPGSSCIQFDPGTGNLSTLLGGAENTDFLNADTGDNAFIQGEFPEFLVLLRAFGFFNAVLGVPVNGNDPASVAQAVSTAVVNQVANTAAHELGHLLGLRHHDSFGAPGDGLPTTGTPRPDTFVPVFDRGQNAAETVLHLMATGTSLSASIARSFSTDPFFGEREATKLLAARFALRQREALVNRRSNRDVAFTRFLVPNTVLEGENAGSKFLDVQGALITEASIDPANADTYRFRGKAGEFINAEVVSFSNQLVEDSVITNINLYSIDADGSRTLVAFNAQTFESFDPFLLDVQLPRSGNYELEIVSANQVIIGGTVTPLVGVNAEFTAGTYELIAYMVNGPLNLRRSRN